MGRPKKADVDIRNRRVMNMAKDKKIIHDVDIRIHLSIDDTKLNGRDILDIPLKELLNMTPSTFEKE